MISNANVFMDAMARKSRLGGNATRGSRARRGAGAVAKTLPAAPDFHIHGAICRIDEFGECFNFPQRWSPYRGVVMATSLPGALPTATLALNILDGFFRRAQRRPASAPDRRAVRLMHAFAQEILGPLAESSWHLPIESIHEWCQARDRHPPRA